MFKTLNSIEEMKYNIKSESLSFFYITQPNCSVCHGLQPQIEMIMKDFPKIHCYTVDASNVPEIAGEFQVFTAPTLLLFVEGKEYIREARFVQTEKFQQQVARIYRNFSESTS